MTNARATVELTADLCDGVYDLEAVYPAQAGENLPFAQTLFEYAGQGQLSLRYALEKGLGIENPEDMMIEIAVEKLLNTPPGQSLILGYAKQDANDKALSKLEEMFAAGLVAQDGTPTAAMGGMDQHLTGMAPAGNPAANQLGGIVGGAMETASVNRDAMAPTSGMR